MGLFTKPEVVILKESSDAQKYLEQLEFLYERATGTVRQQIEKEMKYTKAGIIGEEKILFELKNSGMDMYVLHDICIEAGDLSAQIDFYVITPKVTFLIECKNLFGDIEINNQGAFIRTFEIGGKKIKEGIYSPITQNERHMLVVKNKKLENAGTLQRFVINKCFDDYHKPLVVLANSKTVLNAKYAKKEIKEKVIRADQLVTTMKKIYNESKEISSSKKAMQEEAEALLALNVEERKEYIKKFQDMLAEVEAQKVEAQKIKAQKIEVRKIEVQPAQEAVMESAEKSASMPAVTDICPRCGKKLIKRNGKFGAFFGCSGYPKCHYTKN